MKRILIVSVLVGAVAAVALANLSGKKQSSQQTEKKEGQKEKKKECRRSCFFS